MKIEIINGPNLNLLGVREPETYGHDTLADIERMIRAYFAGDIERMIRAQVAGNDLNLTFHQSNSEGAIIDLLHGARYERGADGIVLNPGAYTHYSIAIRDAISSIAIPVVEVHLSNIHAREPFRQVSVVAPVCKGRIEGLGWRGYALAIRYLIDTRK